MAPVLRVLCVCLILLSYSPAWALRSVEVGSEGAFEAAIVDQSVNTISFTNDTYLSDAFGLMTAKGIAVQRDLTLQSKAGAKALYDLDFQMVVNRIQLGPQTLTLRNLIISAAFLSPSPALPIFTATVTDTATVVVQDSVMVLTACPPLDKLAGALQALSWAPTSGQPTGSQQAAITDDDLVLPTGQRFRGPLIHVASLSASLSSYSGSSAAVYRLLNSTIACDNYVSVACLAVNDSDVCSTALVKQLRQAQVDAAAQAVAAEKAKVAARNKLLSWALPVGITLFILMHIPLGILLWRCAKAREAKKRAAEAAANGKRFNLGTKMMELGDYRTEDGDGWAIEVPSSDIALTTMLGAGSFGRVYKGVWQGREVAVKVLRHHAKSAQQVQNEVNLSMNLEHPNVVKTLHTMNVEKGLTPPAPEVKKEDAWGTSDPFSTSASKTPATASSNANSICETWIVQELCDQGSLSSSTHNGRWTLPSGAPNVRAILKRALDVARGMEYLHSRHIVHGDLKCENVLLAGDPADPDNPVGKVADFGLSRAVGGEKTHLTTQTVGTITHMAPELLMTGRLSAPSDVYSFGMILWELYTGRLPFQGMLHGEVISKIIMADERPAFPAHVPAEFKGLAARCWTKEASGRPPYTEVVTLVEALLGQVDGMQAFINDHYVPEAKEEAYQEHGLQFSTDDLQASSAAGGASVLAARAVVGADGARSGASLAHDISSTGGSGAYSGSLLLGPGTNRISEEEVREVQQVAGFSFVPFMGGSK